MVGTSEDVKKHKENVKNTRGRSDRQGLDPSIML